MKSGCLSAISSYRFMLASSGNSPSQTTSGSSAFFVSRELSPRVSTRPRVTPLFSHRRGLCAQYGDRPYVRGIAQALNRRTDRGNRRRDRAVRFSQSLERYDGDAACGRAERGRAEISPAAAVGDRKAPRLNPHDRYFPLKRGGRFSLNDAMPSRRSSVGTVRW